MRRQFWSKSFKSYRNEKTSKKKKKKIHVGEIVCVTVKKARRKEKFKKEFFFALVLSSKALHKRNQGFYLKADKNRALLLTQAQKILGSRIYGPVYAEIKKKAQKKKFI